MLKAAEAPPRRRLLYEFAIKKRRLEMKGLCVVACLAICMSVCCVVLLRFCVFTSAAYAH